MSPLPFLILLAVITLIAAAMQAITRRKRVRALQELANRWEMHYSATDRFQLAARVAQVLPIPGAAAVRVLDLIYGLEGDHYRYLLTAEFTTGVLRGKSRGRVVATFAEPRDRSSAKIVEPVFGPERLGVVEQYRHLHETIESSED
jgi:hypothetical protein